ncbi:StsA family sactipeptide RiPP [Kitasatospora viridis]
MKNPQWITPEISPVDFPALLGCSCDCNGAGAGAGSGNGMDTS